MPKQKTEALLRKLVKRQIKDSMYIKLQTNPLARRATPFDAIVMCAKPVGVECKEVNSSRFAINRVAEHQRLALLQWQEVCAVNYEPDEDFAYVFVHFREKRVAFMIPVHAYVLAAHEHSKKSWNFVEMKAAFSEYELEPFKNSQFCLPDSWFTLN